MSDQVICVDVVEPSGGQLRKNQIYTIRRFFDDYFGHGPGYYFEEILSPQLPTYGCEAAFNARDFRPIKDSSLDIFRDINRKIPSDKFDKEKIDV